MRYLWISDRLVLPGAGGSGDDHVVSQVIVHRRQCGRGTGSVSSGDALKTSGRPGGSALALSGFPGEQERAVAVFEERENRSGSSRQQ